MLILNIFILFFVCTFFTSIHAQEPVDPSVYSMKEALESPYIYETVDVITGDYCESQIDFKHNGPSPLVFKRYYRSSDSTTQGWHFNHPHIPSPAPFDLSQSKNIHYGFDDEGRLSEIKTGDSSTFKISYNSEETGKLICKADCDEGDFVQYTFGEVEATRSTHPYILEKVITSEGKEVSYTYQDHPLERRKIISSRNEPLGRYLIAEYYDSFVNNVGGEIVTISDLNRDTRLGRVKLLRAPVGVDETPVITHRFFYDQGHTIVYDALNHKTIYYHGKNKKLTAIENYLDENSLYRTERFFWNKNDQLISKVIEDKNGVIQHCETFEYDNHSNLTKHTLWGNLSGNCLEPIQTNEKGIPLNEVESYSTLYRYTNDEKHLLTFIKEDSGKITRFFYEEDTDQVSCKLVHNKQGIQIRQFFQYDDQGNLLASIVDDGSCEECSNLCGVTERRITRFSYPSSSKPYPESVDELYLDEGVEKLLKRTLLTYSQSGKVTQQEVYDPEGNLCQSITYTYDQAGRITQTNEENTVYDELGNVIEITTPESTINNDYDLSNRLIKTEKAHPDGFIESISYRYDKTGNRISSKDLFGNETTYTYDPLGRLIETTYPLVSDADDKPIHPSVSQTYDLLDRVISITDPNGHTTTTEYNARGNPIKVVYPNGSTEEFDYSLDGSIKKKKDQNGNVTTYERDFLSRVISEKCFDSDEKLIHFTHYEYSSFHLVSQNDHLGNSIHHFYDKAGRQVGTTEQTPLGTKQIQMIYDKKGGMIARKEWFESEQEQAITASIEENTITVTDDKGNILKKTPHLDEFKSEETSPKIYNFDFYNDFSQNVLQVTETDPYGNTLTTTHDAMGRVVKIEKTDCLGQLVQEKEIRYDPAGNKSKEIYGPASTYICRWEWGPENRVISFTEGYGTHDSRKTHYTYTLDGKPETITKPDSVTLVYRYTATGQPLSIKSSDATIHYSYHYDQYNRLIQVTDHTNNTTTQRKYNEHNQTIYEKLGNGLEISKEYDLHNRCKCVTLPDHSQIAYHYDTIHLRSIDRLNTDGSINYTHSYDDYSLEGKILKETLIGKSGDLTHTYDDSGKLHTITSNHWKQTLHRDEWNRISSVITEDPSGDDKIDYDYNSLSQLTKESSHKTTTYAYDSLLNRVENNGQPLSYDSLGQLTFQNGKHYRYDLNGNVISIENDTEKMELEYDAFNRLTKILINHNHCLSYHYDAFSRRLLCSEQIGESTVHTKRYLYDGNREIGAIDEQGSLIEFRVLGKGIQEEIGAAVAIETQTGIFAPIHDHRGSICCLVDKETGEAIEWTRYSSFGIEQNFTLNSTGNPWKFCSQRIDQTTQLIFFGHRYYHPESGRWITKDPLGTPESINRYVYNKNDPINRIDPQGLFSFSHLWDTLWDTLYSIYEYAVHTLNSLKMSLSCEKTLHSSLCDAATFVFGKSFLHFSGFHQDNSETGIYGKGEINEKVRITLVNGILNARVTFKQTVQLFSEWHGGTNIHYIFNATDGWCWDLIIGIFVKCGYVTPEAHMIAETWKQMIEEMGGVDGGGIIYHYAHSMGGTHTYSALSLMSEEEKKLIRLFTFGSPKLIEDPHLDCVYNYVSVRDGVCLLDPIGYISGILGLNEHVIPIGSWLGIPFADHLMLNSSYTEIAEMLGHYFLQLCL